MGKRKAADPDAQYFRFLNRLRAGGRTNMYGAIPYLVSAFGLEREAAFQVVCRWIDAWEEKQSQSRAAPMPEPVVVRRPRRTRSSSSRGADVSPRADSRRGRRKSIGKR